MEVKKIDFQIKNGAWKNPFFEPSSKYTYPILITSIEDINDKKISIPFNHKNVNSIVKNHGLKEKWKDIKYGTSEFNKFKNELLSVFSNISNISKEEIEKEINELKKRGGFIEGLNNQTKFYEILNNGE